MFCYMLFLPECDYDSTYWCGGLQSLRLHTVTFEDLADYALAGQMVMRTCIHELYLNIGKVKKAAQGLCGFKLWSNAVKNSLQ